MKKKEEGNIDRLSEIDEKRDERGEGTSNRKMRYPMEFDEAEIMPIGPEQREKENSHGAEYGQQYGCEKRRLPHRQEAVRASVGNVLAVAIQNDSRPRNKTSPKQLNILEKVSQTVLKPDKSLRQRLSNELGMTQRQVQIWFQNRRAKLKKMRDIEEGVVSKPGRRGRQRRNSSAEELYDTLDTPVAVAPTILFDTMKEYSNPYYRGENPYYASPHIYHVLPSYVPPYYALDRTEPYGIQRGPYLYAPKNGEDSVFEYFEEQPAPGIDNTQSNYQDSIYYPKHPFYHDGQQRK